ncbi:MAG: hypothetical protein J0I12_04495, partial [Candidatus Eremiobacteraeota bacterium]|nr:hypothetical protein [Candidatus Eremiobacteraeota bacterium]
MLTKERRFLVLAGLLFSMGYARTAATLARQFLKRTEVDPLVSASRSVSTVCKTMPAKATVGFVDGHRWPVVDDGLVSKFMVQFTLAPRLVFPRGKVLRGEDYLLTYDLRLDSALLVAESNGYRLYARQPRQRP